VCVVDAVVNLFREARGKTPRPHFPTVSACLAVVAPLLRPDTDPEVRADDHLGSPPPPSARCRAPMYPALLTRALRIRTHPWRLRQLCPLVV
jgi:hypothetical protein